jgi:UrcA family protein
MTFNFAEPFGTQIAKHCISEAGWSGGSAKQRRNTMFATNSIALRTLAGTVGTIIFAGACLFGATAPAVAAEAPRTAKVSYTDLNLASDKGRAVLDARIRQAARSVCFEGGQDLRSKTEESRCLHEAIKSAQPGKLAAAAEFKG